MLAVCTTPARINVAAEADSVRARSEAVTAAEAALDRNKAMSFWAEDAIYQPVGAPQVQGRDTISELYKRFLETSGIKIVSSKASQIVVAQSGDLAYETGVKRILTRDLILPPDLPGSALSQPLADLAHEHATPARPDVRRLWA